MNRKITRVSPEAMRLLMAYAWPGNVRELENAIERALVVAEEPELSDEDFTLKLHAAASESRTLDDVERAHILRVLEECGGNKTRAASILDIDRVTLHNKLKRYGYRKTTAEAS
jgi:two-component system response regulator HydG